MKLIEGVKKTTRIVADWIEEVSWYAYSPTDMLAEYDRTAKELRLVRQAIERANHSIKLDFSPKF